MQEVHGSPEEFWAEFGHYMSRYEIFFSPGVPYDAGGVATFVKKASFDQSCTFISEEVVAGRVIVASIDRGSGGACTFDFVNIHNHDLSKSWVQVAADLQSPISRSLADPHQFGCVLLGDFSHIFESSLAGSVASAELSASPLSSIHSPSCWHRWLAKLVEIRASDLNHFNAGVGKINLLSRAFVSVPK